MNLLKKFFIGLSGLLLAASLVSCGGGGSGGNLSGGGNGGNSGDGGTSSNSVSVSVNDGATTNSINTLFVSVTICVPGTSNCQTIPNIQVDTGSYGLRVLGSVLSLSLPTQTAARGGAVLECLSFVDGYVWGPVALADVKLSGETASSVPLQVIGDSRYPNVPSDCSSLPGDEEDTVTTFGANGILGVGPFIQDCGQVCADNAVQAAYYACTSSAATSCTSVAAPLAQQVQSVVALFATDNNGVIIDMPAVSNPAVGASTLSGTMYFGIDTQTNNASGSQTVIETDDIGEFTIAFNGQSFSQSFIDSGTNGNYFTSNLPTCTQTNYTDFYCPTSTQSLSATLHGLNGITSVIPFSVANTYTMLNANPTFAVFPDLGGTYPGTTPTFDFGLPFFYGRRVAVALENVTTAVGAGPYFAF